MISFLDLIKPLTDFCIKQDTEMTADDNEIKLTVREIMTYCDKLCRHADLKGMMIPKYSIFLYGKPCEKMMPVFKSNKDRITMNGLILGEFPYSEIKLGGQHIQNGWELIFDLEERIVKLVYKVVFKDGDITTVYRVEDDYLEEYNFNYFILNLFTMLECELKKEMEAECA